MMKTLAMALGAMVVTAAGSASRADPTPSFDHTARILAGLDKDGVANEKGEQKLVDGFAKVAVKKWAEYMKRIGTPMMAWGKTELKQVQGETIFYPFAGPDFPTVAQLYPDAGRYVLVALQTGGRAPKLENLELKALTEFIAVFKRGWTDFANRGFFRTDDLKADTGKEHTLEGITPVLMAFASASGFKVTNVEPIRIKAGGGDVEIHPGSRDEVATWDSVRLSLERPDGRKVTLDYVWLDLSDGYLKAHADAKAWIAVMSKERVFTKAASHLMQKSFFAIVRDTILAAAPSVVQDETGLDYGDLQKGFTVTLYGKFSAAHHLFQAGVQRALVAAYKKKDDVKPVKFRFGYDKDAGSCIQVAVRK